MGVVRVSEVIHSAKVEYVSVSGGPTIWNAKVSVSRDRILIQKGYYVESLLPQYINVVRYQRDSKSEYVLIASILFSISGLAYFMSSSLPTPVGRIDSILISLVLLGVAVAATIAWILGQKHTLTLISFGHSVKLKSRNSDTILDLFHAIEQVKIKKEEEMPAPQETRTDQKTSTLGVLGDKTS